MRAFRVPADSRQHSLQNATHDVAFRSAEHFGPSSVAKWRARNFPIVEKLRYLLG
jgi:hypothetical protein